MRDRTGIAGVFLLGCAAMLTATQVPAADRAGGVVEDAALAAFLQQAFDDLDLVPGMSVAVVRGDAPVLLRGFGVTDVSSRTPVTADTPFYIASSTKSFTGMAAAILEQRGRWDLDDPLRRWLPAARLPASISADTITLRDLLTHTSRIDNDAIVFRTAYSGEHDRELLVRLLGESGVKEPGFAYGNIGYVVASLAMETAAGTAWKDVVAREILDPLGMKRTSGYRSAFDGQVLALPHGAGSGPRAFEIRPYIKHDVNMHAAGGLITTAADLARWLEANLNDGRMDGNEVLPAAAVREAHRQQASTKASFFQFARTGYGLGWYHSQYDGELVLHHFGNYPGFRAHVSFMPRRRIGVAVLSNESSRGYFVPEAVATWIYDRLLKKPDAAKRYAASLKYLRDDADRVWTAVVRDRRNRTGRPETLSLPAAAYIGTYTSPLKGTLRIETASHGRLRATIGVMTSLIEPIDDRTRVRVELIPGSGQEIEFALTDAKATSLTYDEAVFSRRE